MKWNWLKNSIFATQRRKEWQRNFILNTFTHRISDEMKSQKPTVARNETEMGFEIQSKWEENYILCVDVLAIHGIKTKNICIHFQVEMMFFQWRFLCRLWVLSTTANTKQHIHHHHIFTRLIRRRRRRRNNNSKRLTLNRRHISNTFGSGACNENARHIYIII